MLEKQKWMYFAEDLYAEWQQSMDEGKRIGHLKELCLEVSKQPRSEDYSKIAEEIALKITEAPEEENYPYMEPSDLAGILAVRPVKRRNFTNTLTESQLKDKLTGAWAGRIAGCLLGKPVEGYMRDRLEKLLKGTGNYPLSRYMTADTFSKELINELRINTESCWADTISGIAPVDDDTNYTVFALKLIGYFGKGFRPNDVLEAWLGWIPMLATFTAERAAYRNAANGLLAPHTAVYKNPFREYIGAQIRGDFFGYINPGEPEKAAEMAWRDACVSHVKNGIYGEMFVSAILAAAAVCDDIMTVIEAGLDEIPEKSRLRRDIEKVIQWHAQGLNFEIIVDNIHGLYDEHQGNGWCHTNPNAMIVAAALLYGNKDYGKTVCLAVQAAFDTDCNGATAGSIIGMMTGIGNIPACWIQPFNNRLATSITDFTETTVPELVEKTIEIIKN